MVELKRAIDTYTAARLALMGWACYPCGMIGTRLALFFADGRDSRIPAPEGPGWYLYATEKLVVNGSSQSPVPAEIIPRVRLSPEEAIKFAKVVDNFVNGKPLNRTPKAQTSEYSSLEAAVTAENQKAKLVIKSELEEAQRAVQNLEILRQRAQEFGVND